MPLTPGARIVTAIVVTCVSLAASQSASAQSGFVNVPFTIDGVPAAAALWVPPGYDPARKWPLVVFLHGGSSRGDHGTNATGAWLDSIPFVQAIRKDPGRVPGLVLIPRCPEQAVWVKHPANEQVPECCRSFATATKEAQAVVDAALDRVLGTYAIDVDRIVLTGESLGGQGSFRYGAVRADRFAGIAPVSGFGAFGDAAALAKVPMWVFHGDADTTIPIVHARATVEAVRKAGGNVRFTEFPGVTHSGADIDPRVYGDPEVMAWLFSQRRTPQSRPQ